MITEIFVKSYQIRKRNIIFFLMKSYLSKVLRQFKIQFIFHSATTVSLPYSEAPMVNTVISDQL